jgi:hypothetical protein
MWAPTHAQFIPSLPQVSFRFRKDKPSGLFILFKLRHDPRLLEQIMNIVRYLADTLSATTSRPRLTSRRWRATGCNYDQAALVA